MSTLVLDSTTKTIKVNMSGAAATTNPDYIVSYADNNGTTFTEGALDGALNGVTDVTVVSAPASSTRRIVKSIYIENKDTAAVTITVKYDNNATQRTIVKVTLAVGDTWSTDGAYDTNGALKQTLGTVNLASVTGTLPIANGGTGLTAGTSGGIPAYTATGTLTSSALLTQYGVVYGGGAGAVPVATANGTTGQAFVATTSGAPSWGTLGPAGGGTGVANNAAMTVTGSGNFAYTRTLTAATNVTFPTTGTLSTLAGTETLTNKTLTNPTVTNYTETLFTANTSTALTVSLANGTVQQLTLTGNATITMPTATAGKSFIILLKQDATGGRSVTWSTVKYPGGTAPTITATASRQDIFSFFADGTNWYGTTVGLNYTP